jgi:hypothetical protein
MKNIHILPTNQPSRLCIDNSCNELNYSEKEGLNSKHITNQCMYITSDEEIKEGDYCVDGNDIYGPYEDGDIATDKFIKIILTTDSQLIRYGVQAIDDEFLEWFIKNPTCEFVKVTKLDYLTNRQYRIYNLPQEEPKQDLEKEMFELEQELDIPSSMRWHNSKPKQETLEEAAEKLAPNSSWRLGFIAGGNYMAERMYSEQIELINWLQQSLTAKKFYSTDAKDLIEQFKKK